MTAAKHIISEILESAVAATDADGVEGFLEHIFNPGDVMVERNRSQHLRMEDNDEMFQSLQVARSPIVNSLLSTKRTNVLGRVRRALEETKAGYEGRLVRMQAEHAAAQQKVLEHEPEMLRMEAAENAEDARIQANIHESYEAQNDIRRLSVEIQLRPSQAIRSFVENKTLSDVLRLAQAADQLAVKPLLELCSLSVSAFFTQPIPQDVGLTVHITNAIRGPNMVPAAVVRTNTALVEDAATQAMEQVIGDSTLDADVHAGLAAVNNHLRFVMEPWRRSHYFTAIH